MIKIHTLTLGDYQTNCYCVHEADSQRCVLIDPGYDAERILEFLQAQKLTLDAILLTHGHFDHVGAVKALVMDTDCQLWMSQSDWTQTRNPLLTYLYPLANCAFSEVHFCQEGEHIHGAGLTFEVWETPGHTWGSVCFRCGDDLFTGDTLFDGSCGRTDLPGGDHKTILESLQRLKNVPDDLRIFPGHGTASTLEDQRRYNPYLR